MITAATFKSDSFGNIWGKNNISFALVACGKAGGVQVHTERLLSIHRLRPRTQSRSPAKSRRTFPLMQNSKSLHLQPQRCHVFAGQEPGEDV